MKREYRWVTEDGTTFETEGAARAHERRAQFKAWYEQEGHRLYASYSPCPTVHFDDLVAWLRMNRLVVEELIDLP